MRQTTALEPQNPFIPRTPYDTYTTPLLGCAALLDPYNFKDIFQSLKVSFR